MAQNVPPDCWECFICTYINHGGDSCAICRQSKITEPNNEVPPLEQIESNKENLSAIDTKISDNVTHEEEPQQSAEIQINDMSEEEQMKKAIALSLETIQTHHNTADQPVSARKKRKRSSDDCSPSKRRKTEHVHSLQNDIEPIQMESAQHPLSTEDKHYIDTQYKSFLKHYLFGEYCLRTVVIEYGPKFQGRKRKSKIFTKILSDPKWRPVQLKLPKHMAFNSENNCDLPPFVCRIKHHTIKHDKQLIYKHAMTQRMNIHNEKELRVNELGDYFLQCLRDVQHVVYSNWIMIRLEWETFHDLWSEKGEKTLDELIDEVKLVEGCEYICVVMEGVTNEIAKQQRKRHIDYILGTKVEGNDDGYFMDAQQLRDTMMSYYFKDKTVHFIYTNNKKETAEYVIRAARSLAEWRFKQLKQDRFVDERNNNGAPFSNMLRLLHGFSKKKAEAVTKIYPTVGLLVMEYRKLDENKGELLLENILVDNDNNCVGRIGQALSKKVYHTFYGNMNGDKLVTF